MKILVIGDSHSKIFNQYSGNEFEFTVKAVDGATVRGAINPNTTTNSLNIFRECLQEYTNFDKIFIVLGEVDCGYLIWYKFLYEDLDPQEQMKESIGKLKQFTQNEIIQYFSPNNIFLISSTPPVIENNVNPKFLAGARSKVTTPIEDRLKLTLDYNQSLNQMAKELKCHYLDITPHILDYQIKRVKKEWLREDPNDHHLNHKTIDLWINEFKTIIK